MAALTGSKTKKDFCTKNFLHAVEGITSTALLRQKTPETQHPKRKNKSNNPHFCDDLEHTGTQPCRRMFMVADYHCETFGKMKAIPVSAT